MVIDRPAKLVIVGAGGLGREVLATARACNAVREQWEVLGFLDSDKALWGIVIGGAPVVGGDEWCRNHHDGSVRFICAIGNPRARSRVVEKLSAMNCRFASVVHPDVQIPESVEIGVGTVIMAGTQFTTDAKIGSHVVVYLNCSITHDVRVADFCLIPSGCNLSGAAVLEAGVELGTGVSILPGRRVGAWAIIGAGSVVAEDIPANSTAVGTPCRVIKQRD
jgi:sugar O-acyltransferase (sialic acid O-acetyltransferase NeuD family)